MKRDEFRADLQAGLEATTVTPALRRQTLDRIQGKEQPIMKKKLSVALAMTLALILLAAAAVAAAHSMGMIDFLGRYQNSYVPDDAQQYVQTGAARAENDAVTAHVRETYYDGKVARLVVDVAPKAATTLLFGDDLMPEDNWQNLRHLSGTWDENDRRTLADYCAEGGYQAAYGVWIDLRPADETIHMVAGSMDYDVSEDGTVTLFYQAEYNQAPAVLEAELDVTLVPYQLPLTDESRQPEARQMLTLPLQLHKAQATEEAYLCTQPVELPGIGVRVDGLLVQVKPQEIYVTLDFTVTDREAYAKTNDGLWFEFIDPESTAEEYYQQQLKSGLTGSGAVSPMDSDDLALATQYRQTETLGCNELHETYTLRAYDAWEKTRFDTFEMAVEPATAEEVAAFLGK